MARVESGKGSWFVFATLLLSSSIVLILEWDKDCDGGLRQWLLIAVCVTAVCGILGAVFHGKGDGTRPSRFLDDDEDDEYPPNSGAVPAMGLNLGPMEGSPNGDRNNGVTAGGTSLPTLAEEGGVSPLPGGSVASDLPGSCGSSVTSRRESSVSAQLALRASSSLQRQYFGTGPKVFPDAIFLVLVLSQWFMAAWSVVGAILYFRLFEADRTCSPLLRHWTLLVVIIGFLSCLLTVCYSGIMCYMMGSPFKNGQHRSDHSCQQHNGFGSDIASGSDISESSTTAKGVGMM